MTRNQTLPRSDARANRTRLLEVARLAFIEDPTVSMNQIAQRAGVGPGTLYRNFPHREALVLAVYEDEVGLLLGRVDELLASTPSAVDALRTWTNDLVDAMKRKHGLGDALSPRVHQSIAEQTYQPAIDAITRLLDAGKQEGTIRPDADPRDFLQLTGALWRAALGPEDRSQQILGLILDGLTARATP